MPFGRLRHSHVPKSPLPTWTPPPNTPAQAPTGSARWTRATSDTFQQAARPHIDRLITAARHDLDYYVEQGELHSDDFTPEEIAGETLIYAWDHREKRPEQVSLEGWLLGTQHRLLRGMVAEAMQYREEKALSLDEQIPADAKAEGEQAPRSTPRTGACPTRRPFTSTPTRATRS
ncbi:MAG: hypothetical protein BRD37_00055 [Bacteroidetes bacterium QH_8_67_23]|nr:MAG: hypothetical protein BRD37_00055 [Bacteroidetes bacterium QH_8_67_23]